VLLTQAALILFLVQLQQLAAVQVLWQADQVAVKVVIIMLRGAQELLVKVTQVVLALRLAHTRQVVAAGQVLLVVMDILMGLTVTQVTVVLVYQALLLARL
jgi:hypothetical protein